jgi:RNA polymerase-binding transcription factor DksA
MYDPDNYSLLKKRRKKMKHLSSAQIQELKSLLEDNLAKMLDYAENLEESDPANDENRANDNAEAGDEALEDYGILENQVLEGAVDESIADIKAALTRLENGTYGVDEETGEPIPFARLKLFPTARNNVKQDE